MVHESPWVELFQKNPSASRGVSLDYRNGETVVQLDKTAMEKENGKWRRALIAYVKGEAPGYNYMRRYLERTWDVAKPEIYLHEDGYYVVQFQSSKTCNRFYVQVPIPLITDPSSSNSGRMSLISY